MENILFFTPDIRALIQNVHLGPQARVKELIDDFNFRYSRYMKKNLDITKKFYWKPGAYDTIKEVIWFLGDLDKKANSLTKVVQRSKDSHYRLRTLIQYTDVIESLLFDFRSRGMVQQDNTDDAIEAWNVIKNHLSEQVSNMNRFNVYVEPIMLDDELQDYYIHIIYRYDDVVINYEHNQGPRIAEIEIPGEGHLTVKMPLSRLLNNVIYKKFDISKLSNFKYARNENRKWDFRIGGDYHGYDEIQHPYIARDGSLNQLDTTYHGVPKQLLGNEEFWDIRGMKQSSQCNYPIDDYDDPIWVKEDSYCALFCTLKDECVQYQRNAKELTQQEITQKALEQATLQLARGGR